MAIPLQPTTGQEFVKKLCEALGVPYEMTRRIVLDVGTDCAITAYIEMYASEQVVDLEWEKGLHGMEVCVLSKRRQL
jgi:hypothetical protein